MNRAILYGEIVSPANFDHTGNGTPVFNFKVQCTERHNDRTFVETHNVTAWGGLASMLFEAWRSDTIAKGKRVLVEGRISTKDGGLEIHAKRVEW